MPAMQGQYLLAGRAKARKEEIAEGPSVMPMPFEDVKGKQWVVISVKGG